LVVVWFTVVVSIVVVVVACALALAGGKKVILVVVSVAVVVEAVAVGAARADHHVRDDDGIFNVKGNEEIPHFPPTWAFGPSPHLVSGPIQTWPLYVVAWSSLALAEHHGQIHIAGYCICHDLVACSTKLR
jgi:hypothetical protein